MDHGTVEWQISPDVYHTELDARHSAAFGGQPDGTAWTARLRRHSLFWVVARYRGRPVGFVS
ncbi:hypothetical protein [Luteococcus peritonei]|uniref:GNAT family N-acetyltransferase n=1 Tax=Luteococcus peritonei TaxID=88874 RepID=A0ABW4RS48_9ACTN